MENVVFVPDVKAELTLSNRAGGLIIVETAVLHILNRYRQLHHSQPEQGGVFIGEIRPPHIIITHVTEPSPYDQASRFGFVRKKQHHQVMVDQLWHTSGGYLTYIGEWHTHPESNPLPSATDVSSWRKGLPKNSTSIVAIIGQKTDWWGYCENGRCEALKNILI
ncbi:peptidase [Aeromonas hydrophila]|nr:peptidase [Aeromonas veronii]RQM70457.1 peptidase [Aeromonas jandaei]TNH80850.1 peptidase [Aeromonas hydrophila]TNI00484.1 peptidase [Aeromonas hydrophila]TNJ00619.1 peptidase [Aeromonas hydrophila]